MGEELKRLTAYPPEGVEWANRWAELENAYAELEAQRDSLQLEVDGLRRSQDSLQEGAPSAPSNEELDGLREQLEEAKKQADLRFTEEVRKEEKISRLAIELEQQTLRLSEISKQKFQLEYEKTRTESEILPITSARDRLQNEKDAQDKLIEQLRKEQDQLFNEKFEMARNLRRELEAAQAEVKYHQNVAEEAREAQYRERKLKEELQVQLKDEREDFAAKEAVLEENCRIKQEQLDRTTRLWQTCREQLDVAVRGLEQGAEFEKQRNAVQAELEELRQEYESFKQEHEDFLRRRLPGADTGELPRGFESLTELVRIANTSREEALKERAARENLQQVLQDIEKEIRQRYPVLMSQVQELRELRNQNAELKEQNKIIYAKAREYAIYNRDAETRAQRAEQSNKMVEAHAQDLTKQLAIMLYEKNRRTTINLAGTSRTWFALNQAEEENEWPMTSVQEVVEQNVSLRKALRQVEERCRREDVQEMERLQSREEQFEEELEQKGEELKSLQAQLQEVKETLEEAARDRDAAVRKVKTLEAGGASGPLAGNSQAVGQGAAPSGASASPEALSEREALRLKWEREELSDRCERQAAQLKDLEAKGAQAVRDLAVGDAQLQFERQRRSDSEEASKRLEVELKELKERFSQSRARVLQIEYIEGESRRLEAENRSLKDKLHAIEANKQIAPLQEELLEQTKQRNVDLEADRNLHKSKAEEWKSLYDACKFKQEDFEKWNAQEAELNTKIAELEETLSQKEAETHARQADLEAEQTQLKEEREKNDALTKAQEDLEKDLKEKDRLSQEAVAQQTELNKKVTQLEEKLEEERKQAQAVSKMRDDLDKEIKDQEKRLKANDSLKQLHSKRIELMTAEKNKLTEENTKLKGDLAKSFPQAEKTKLTEEISKLKTEMSKRIPEAEKVKLTEEIAKLKQDAAKRLPEAERTKFTEEIAKLKAEAAKRPSEADKTKMTEEISKLKVELGKRLPEAEKIKLNEEIAKLKAEVSKRLPEAEKTKLTEEINKLKAEAGKKVSEAPAAPEAEKSKLSEEITQLKAELAKRLPEAEKIKLNEEIAKLKAELGKRPSEAEKTKLNEEIVRLKAELMKRLPEAEKSKMVEEITRLKNEVAKRCSPEDLKVVQKQGDLAIHLAMEYRKAVEALLAEADKSQEKPPETKLQPASKPKETEAPAEASQSPAGTKRKAETPGPMRLDQLKEANVQAMVEERAPKAVRSEGSAGQTATPPQTPAVKKAPVPPKAASVQPGVAPPASSGPAPVGKVEGAPAASPSLTPRTAPIQIDDDDAAEAADAPPAAPMS